MITETVSLNVDFFYFRKMRSQEIEHAAEVKCLQKKLVESELMR